MWVRQSAGTRYLLGLCLVAVAALLGGCQPTRAIAATSTPGSVHVPSAAKTVWTGNYAVHIQPVFDRHCVGCHGADRAESSLRLTSYDALMKGTGFGPVVTPGSPNQSALISVVKVTADPSLRMPPSTNPRLSDAELQTLVLWISAGARPD